MGRNNLYPVFLKVKNLQVLIVGGGNVAEEKLTFLLKSSPDANITMISPVFSHNVVVFAKEFDIELLQEKYHSRFLKGKHIVIATTNVTEVNMKVYKDCRKRTKLVNVADSPMYCDFYMGGIVTKSNVKIAISTNGKSPTTSKRLRQFFEDVLPEDINELVENLSNYRKTIKGNFSSKVKALNNLTKSLINKTEDVI